MSQRPVLGYWDLRGLGNPIKYLLAYTETAYEDKRYKAANDGDAWFSVKFNQGLDFPNLPYWMEGDVKITQSSAILRYLARKNNLLGKDDKERALVDMAAAEAADLTAMQFDVVYNPDMEKRKAEHLEKLSKKLDMIEKFIGDKDFLVGNEVTMPDFPMYEILSHFQAFAPDTMAKYAKIAAYRERFENLPKIKAYMESPDFIKYPWNGPRAGWGGK